VNEGEVQVALVIGDRKSRINAREYSTDVLTIDFRFDLKLQRV
jgi:hypothetical protein